MSQRLPSGNRFKSQYRVLYNQRDLQILLNEHKKFQSSAADSSIANAETPVNRLKEIPADLVQLLEREEHKSIEKSERSLSNDSKPYMAKSLYQFELDNGFQSNSTGLSNASLKIQALESQPDGTANQLPAMSVDVIKARKPLQASKDFPQRHKRQMSIDDKNGGQLLSIKEPAELPVTPRLTKPDLNQGEILFSTNSFSQKQSAMRKMRFEEPDRYVRLIESLDVERALIEGELDRISQMPNRNKNV